MGRMKKWIVCLCHVALTSSIIAATYPRIVQRFRSPQTALDGIWEETWGGLETA